MGEILSKSNINPGAEYNFTSINNALTSVLNITAKIECIREENYPNEQYLSEIRICFDKTLTLIDCNNNLMKRSGIYNTNCNLNQAIFYPNALRTRIDEKPSKSIWQIIWENLLKSSKWLGF